MVNLEPPTGDEQPQKYMGSAYLEERDLVANTIKNAVAVGAEPDLSDFHPVNIAAVNPHYLTDEQRQEVYASTSIGSNVEGTLHPTDGMTMVEANGGTETRPAAGLSATEAHEGKKEDRDAEAEEELQRKSRPATGPISNIEGKNPVGSTYSPNPSDGNDTNQTVTSSVTNASDPLHDSTSPANPHAVESDNGNSDAVEDKPEIVEAQQNATDESNSNDNDNDNDENDGEPKEGLAGKFSDV